MGSGVKKIVFKKKIGSKVRITGIVDSGKKVIDSDLNGREGILTRKFKDIPDPYQQIGIFIKKKGKLPACKANIRWSDCEVIDEWT